MKRSIALLVLMLGVAGPSFADMVWNTPAGTFGIPLQATEALLGYDAVLRQSISGVSLPIYTDPHQFVSLQIGAVATWPSNEPAVEPYLSLGHDIAREIPFLSQYKTVHLNVFGRYVSERGKAGLGVSFSYGFAGGSLPPQ